MIRRTIAAAMLVAMVGSGCSFSPVYSDSSPINAMSLAFTLGKPSSRIEQVIYQDIALRFAVSDAPRTPRLTVSASSSARDVMLSANQGGHPDVQRVSITANATATYGGKTIFTATRTASADYTTSGQVLADKAALADAEERAARAVAESLRLTILATFPNSQSYLTN